MSGSNVSGHRCVRDHYRAWQWKSVVGYSGFVYELTDARPKGAWWFVKGVLQLLVWPLISARISREVKKRTQDRSRLYPDGLTADQERRWRDLGNPFANYNFDDPRRYCVYNGKTSGYVPKPGEEPVRYQNVCKSDWVNYPLRGHPTVTREQFRHYLHFNTWQQHYLEDDPRRYGIYGKGWYGYKPQPEDKVDDPVLRFYNEDGEVWAIDTTELTKEQYRRLLDLGDPDGEYDVEDPRRYGIYFQKKLNAFDPVPEPYNWDEDSAASA